MKMTVVELEMVRRKETVKECERKGDQERTGSGQGEEGHGKKRRRDEKEREKRIESLSSVQKHCTRDFLTEFTK